MLSKHYLKEWMEEGMDVTREAPRGRYLGGFKVLSISSRRSNAQQVSCMRLELCLTLSRCIETTWTSLRQGGP